METWLIWNIRNKRCRRRKSIQIEVDKACQQIGTLRMEQENRVLGPPEPPVRLSGAWPELGTQLMP
jgi:hypothetical protein